MEIEKILHESLDTLISQLSAALQGWEGKSITLHQNYNELLFEFSLNVSDVRQTALPAAAPLSQTHLFKGTLYLATRKRTQLTAK
ncbi:dynein regulatory complex protein 12 [Takifugu rubripes]|uniref:dynein regulatory complex protein 12 n=1 Tax=Takifugu rubripes TaxID=31033 RepID=UPI0011452600|nr:coiled-coil domain-containing protein 153-like [Takifugu rubripes]